MFNLHITLRRVHVGLSKRIARLEPPHWASWCLLRNIWCSKWTETSEGCLCPHTDLMNPPQCVLTAPRRSGIMCYKKTFNCVNRCFISAFDFSETHHQSCSFTPALEMFLGVVTLWDWILFKQINRLIHGAGLKEHTQLYKWYKRAEGRLHAPTFIFLHPERTDLKCLRLSGWRSIRLQPQRSHE